MLNEILQILGPAFREAISEIIVVAVRGGLLAWGVFMGKLLGTGFFEQPSRKKVFLISMPIALFIAALVAFYSYKCVVNPGETRTEAIHDAALTFFCVLLPLWTGCIWGIVKLQAERRCDGESKV
jgi:hypothetical protein